MQSSIWLRDFAKVLPFPWLVFIGHPPDYFLERINHSTILYAHTYHENTTVCRYGASPARQRAAGELHAWVWLSRRLSLVLDPQVDGCKNKAFPEKVTKVFQFSLLSFLVFPHRHILSFFLSVTYSLFCVGHAGLQICLRMYLQWGFLPP